MPSLTTPRQLSDKAFHQDAAQGSNWRTRIGATIAVMQRTGVVRNQSYESVDEEISPLVIAMNATGVIRTVGSCQGHATGRRAPYVYFKAPVEIAALIELALRKDAASDGSQFRTFWTVDGLFGEEGELVFRLHAPEYDARSGKLPEAMCSFYLFRSRINSELMSLGEVVQKAVLSYFGQHGHYGVGQCGDHHRSTDE